MTPVQDIKIKTKKSRQYDVELRKQSDTCFICTLAGDYSILKLPTDPTYGPFSKGESAKDAFQALIQKSVQYLSNYDSSDSISEINNPYNAELIGREEQQEIVNNIADKPISILVNGV